MSVCVYTQKRSPFFWLKYGPSDAPNYESSKVRIDDPDADYKIAKKVNQIEGRLLVRNTKSGWDWAPAFFKAIYTNKDSRRIHLNAWNYIAAYLRYRDIRSPDALGPEQVFEYLEWRTSQKKQKSRRSPARNTAIYEIRVLGRIMAEAIRRDMVDKNPVTGLKLRRDPPRETPEILPEQQKIILNALHERPAWMQRSFRIALQTGLRFLDTIIDLRREVDWTKAEITRPTPKGGSKRAFTFTILQMSLVPYLQAIPERYTWQRSGLCGNS